MLSWSVSLLETWLNRYNRWIYYTKQQDQDFFIMFPVTDRSGEPEIVPDRKLGVAAVAWQKPSFF